MSYIDDYNSAALRNRSHIYGTADRSKELLSLCFGRFTSKKRKFELIMAGNNLEPIETMGGIFIKPEISVDNIEFKEGDVLILPGADTWMDGKNKKILEMLPELINRKLIVAAICGATVALAHMGLLDNRNHTSNDKEFLRMVCPGYSGTSFYSNQPVVVDDNLITATGLAPLEFSHEIFKKVHVMEKETLEAWYQLYRTREPKYFYTSMESLK